MSVYRSLRVVEPLPAAPDTCCDACAGAEAARAAVLAEQAHVANAQTAKSTRLSAAANAGRPGADSARTNLPSLPDVPAALAGTLTPHPAGARPPQTDRSGDRRVTVIGLSLAAGFLALAAVSLFVPNLRGAWLPLHLVLAGAATVAIGAVMPFFASALVAGRPAPGSARLGIIALLAAGALAVTLGFGATNTALAVSGGLLFITGLVALLGLTISILRGSVGAKRRVFTIIYGAAIVNVIVGASLATLFLAGERDIVANWVAIKPAHAWLNLFGFVGLVICASLVHLFPTVVGARMDRGRWSAGAVIALALAPPIVALGFVLRSDPVAQAGALAMIAGMAAQLVAATRVWRGRARWSGDSGWHAMAIGSLWAGLGWFSVGVTAAVAGILRDGTRPEAWSVTGLIAPLGIGFVIQVLIGAWTHLLPAIGPGTMATHAAARRRLGAAALPRLLLLNLGTGVLFAGAIRSDGDLTRLGLGLAGLAIASSMVLFVSAVANAYRDRNPFGDQVKVTNPSHAGR